MAEDKQLKLLSRVDFIRRLLQ